MCLKLKVNFLFVSWPITEHLDFNGWKFLKLSNGAQIWVYGNSFESFLVAVVVPDRRALEDWAVNHLHEAVDFKSLCESSNARKYVLDELNSTAQKHKVCLTYSWFSFLLAWWIILSSDLNNNSISLEVLKCWKPFISNQLPSTLRRIWLLRHLNWRGHSCSNTTRFALCSSISHVGKIMLQL